MDINEIVQLAFDQDLTIRFDGQNLELSDGSTFDTSTEEGSQAAASHLSQEEEE
jgi:hypothetical protein